MSTEARSVSRASREPRAFSGPRQVKLQFRVQKRLASKNVGSLRRRRRYWGVEPRVYQDRGGHRKVDYRRRRPRRRGGAPLQRHDGPRAHVSCGTRLPRFAGPIGFVATTGEGAHVGSLVPGQVAALRAPRRYYTPTACARFGRWAGGCGREGEEGWGLDGWRASPRRASTSKRDGARGEIIREHVLRRISGEQRARSASRRTPRS